MSKQRGVQESELGSIGVRKVRQSAAPVSQRRPLMTALATAGIVGPVMFAVVAFVQSVLWPEHSLVAMPISALAAGPSGWVQHTNFVVLGVLMLAYAIGLHLGVRSARWGVLGPVFLSLSGIGLVWAALFPATHAGIFQADRIPTLHTVGFAITFLGAIIGLIMISRRMALDPGWRSLATYVLATGIAMLVLFVAGSGLARPPGAPLHPWLGLFQWILLTVWFPCTVVLALRLLRVTRAADAPR